MSAQIVGMIVPPEAGEVPPEAWQLYPQGTDFVACGLGLEEMTPSDFSRALERLPAAIGRLLAQGAQAICLMGTSISFYMGRKQHDELLATMRAMAGDVPVSTMTEAIVDGLRQRGIRRLVVATAYASNVSQSLLDFLAEEGFDVVADQHLDLTGVAQLSTVSTADLVALGSSLLDEAPQAEGLLISCGGLRTLDATTHLEEKFGRPVVSSAVQGCHHAVNLLQERLA
jgi:arylmalonate decarboxylase